MTGQWDEYQAALQAYTEAERAYQQTMQRHCAGGYVPRDLQDELMKNMQASREAWLAAIDKITNSAHQRERRPQPGNRST